MSREPKPFTKTIPMTFEMTVEDIVEALELQPDDTLFELITKLDLRAADYSFTLKLAKHFIAELHKESAGAEPLTLSELGIHWDIPR